MWDFTVISQKINFHKPSWDITHVPHSALLLGLRSSNIPNTLTVWPHSSCLTHPFTSIPIFPIILFFFSICLFTIQDAFSTAVFTGSVNSLCHPSSALTSNRSNLKDRDERWERKMIRGNSWSTYRQVEWKLETSGRKKCGGILPFVVETATSC